MLRTLLLFAIITALGSLPSKAQSDDGWFTGRLLLCATNDGNDCGVQVNYVHYYNFSNYFSAGFGEGVIFSPQKLLPTTINLRVRPLGHRRWMPVLLASGGYAVSWGDADGQITLTPRIGLEGGKLARIRLAIDAGCQILGDNCGWIIGAGILF
jgi:hypothetical protein